MKPKFTDRQIAFIKAYVANGNASQAAIKAGYSPKTAASQGQRLLKNVKIRATVDKALAQIADKQEVRAEEVIRETRLLTFSNILDYMQFDQNGTPTFNLGNLDRNLGTAIKAFTITDTKNGQRVSLVLHDKLKALNKLDAATGAFKKHNRGVSDDRNRPIIRVITGISESVGSRVKV